MSKQTCPKLDISEKVSYFFWTREFQRVAVQAELAGYIPLLDVQIPLVRTPSLSQVIRHKLTRDEELTPEEDRTYSRYTETLEKFNAKCAKALNLVQENCSVRTFQSVMSGVANYQRPDLEKMTQVMEYLKENNGGNYSSLADGVNRTAINRLPKFVTYDDYTTVTRQFRLLMEERESWDAGGRWDWRDEEKKFWFLPRCSNPALDQLVLKLTGRRDKTFIACSNEVRTLMEGIRDRDKSRQFFESTIGAPDLIAEVNNIQAKKARGVYQHPLASQEDESLSRQRGMPPSTMTCYGCGKTGHRRSECPNVNPQLHKGYQVAKVERCQTCQGFGHTSFVCPTKSYTSPTNKKRQFIRFKGPNGELSKKFRKDSPALENAMNTVTEWKESKAQVHQTMWNEDEEDSDTYSVRSTEGMDPQELEDI